MDKYRLSYLKTTLFAGLTTVALILIMLVCLTEKHTLILGDSWKLTENVYLYWLIVCFVTGIAFLFFAIAVGGMICLHSDARDRRRD